MKIKARINALTLARQSVISLLKDFAVYYKCTRAEQAHLAECTSLFELNAYKRTLLDKYL